ncbi:hypothetical protein WJX84_004606 [Apatococcus fuscideae]|uniref:Methionyl-tRNA formyltransferase, mitochondrial n=1 Tax=Apatococcus fuscideae TaxID=2026836 RepID=A0AAW1T4A7_9CHLO
MRPMGDRLELPPRQIFGSLWCSTKFLCQAAAQSRRQLVFLGSPEVAADVLEFLSSSSKSDDACTFEVAGVVTQPWAARGRSRKPRPSFVEEAAMRCGLPEERIFRPASAKDAGFLEALAGLKPDLCVTAAYGNLLPQAFLDIPTFGTLNIHPSLLPQFRGAAPVQRALQEGWNNSGVSLAFTVLAMDAGPIVAQETVDMHRYKDANDALQDLFQIGARMLVRELPRVWSGAAAAEARPQDESQATSAPKLCKHDAVLDFSRTAEALTNQVRAFAGWPGSKVSLSLREADGSLSEPFDLKIVQAAPFPRPVEGDWQVPTGGPGSTSITARDGLLIRCGMGSVLKVLMVHPSGRKAMSIDAYLNRLSSGATLVANM